MAGPKNAKVTLSPESKAEWVAIRELITTLGLVRVFDWQKPGILDVDSSDRCTGACFM